MATDDVAVATKVNVSGAKVDSTSLDALRKCWMRKDAKLCVNYVWMSSNAVMVLVRSQRTKRSAKSTCQSSCCKTKVDAPLEHLKASYRYHSTPQDSGMARSCRHSHHKTWYIDMYPGIRYHPTRQLCPQPTFIARCICQLVSGSLLSSA